MLFLQPPSEQTVVAVNHVSFSNFNMGNDPTSDNDATPTSGDVWRYKPFSGTGAAIQAILRMAGSYTDQLSEEEQQAAQEAVYH
jgi:hypothetical protein